MIANHSKHEALNQCWIHAGPSSVTPAHHLRCRCQCVWLDEAGKWYAGDMTGKCFLPTKKQEAFNPMLGLKLGKRRKQWPNIKMCLASCRSRCVFIKLLYSFIVYHRTPTGVIDHKTCADNFLYRPKLVLRLRIIYVILTHCSLNIIIIS